MIAIVDQGAYHPEDALKKLRVHRYHAQILKVEEPGKCEYRITMHVLALCSLPEFAASP